MRIFRYFFNRDAIVFIAECVLSALTFAQSPAENRLALVIGNASYKASPLANPVNDARLMEAALKEAGFTVIKAENASLRDMRRLVRDFGDRLKASGGVGLFYFAGHGVQVRGENYLVSVDSDIRNEDEVADDAINAQLVLEKMQTAGNRMNLVILDACRNNPFAVKSRSAISGLATMNAPSGSLVAYSTAPGSVASDGNGSNGLYTQHLARVIRLPGMPVEEVFKQVRAAVRRESNNQQTPWENTALEGQFYFRPPVQVAPAPVVPPVAVPAKPAGPDPIQLELALWDSIKASSAPAEIQAYLNRYPSGLFADVAKARIAALQAAAAERLAMDRAANERAANERAAAEAALKAASERAAAERAFAERVAAERAAQQNQASQAAASARPPDPQAADIAFWDSIKVSSKPGELQAYLAQFPNGMFAGLAKARLAEVQAPKPQPVTMAAVAPAAQASAKALGSAVLVVRDALTGKEQSMDVVPVASDANGTLWSTGDDIASDGQVRAVRIGTLVVRVQSGALWKLPLQPGAAGSARLAIEGIPLGGDVDWKVVSRNGTQARLEARVNHMSTRGRRYGTWAALYEDGLPLPVSQKTDIRGQTGGGGGPDLFSAELQNISAPNLAAATATAAPAVVQPAAPGGTLVVRDALTGKEQRLEVAVIRADGKSTLWSTGDEIAADGQVLAVRVGAVVARAVSGSLWKLPLQPGTSGAAGITVDGTAEIGKMDWKVQSRAGAKAQLDVRLEYSPLGFPRRSGTWIAQYQDGVPLAISYRTEIRGSNSSGPDILSGELQNVATK